MRYGTSSSHTRNASTISPMEMRLICLQWKVLSLVAIAMILSSTSWQAAARLGLDAFCLGRPRPYLLHPLALAAGLLGFLAILFPRGCGHQLGLEGIQRGTLGCLGFQQRLGLSEVPTLARVHGRVVGVDLH